MTMLRRVALGLRRCNSDFDWGVLDCRFMVMICCGFD